MAQVQQNTSASSPTPSTAGPAVSARILKKRETDRKCQRMIRERTKGRIAYLEGLVEQFRQQDSSGRIETLMAQLSDMKTERDSLVKKVKTIESIISDGQIKQEAEPVVQPVRPGFTPSESSSPTQSSVEVSTVSDYQIFNKEFEARANVSKSTWTATPVPPAPNEVCECTKPVPPTPREPFNKWRFANDKLTEWFKWPQHIQELKYPQELHDDVPVRAVVEGWDTIKNLHPAWQLLRGIDQNLFQKCDKRERLAILQTMGLLLRAHLNPTTQQHAQLPAFYLKRPSQDMLHSYAIEYFAWPGLRERFVFGEHRYCANNFWKVFSESLRVQWQYEFRDCYVKNTDTGLYKISPTFGERISDIRHWTMGREMFKLFPELYGDIPAWDSIPASLIPCGNKRQRVIRNAPSYSNSHDQRPQECSNGISRKRKESTKSLDSQISPSQQIQTFDFDTSIPLVPGSSFDFDIASMITNVTENQPLSMYNSWEYNGSLDTFQLDAA